MRLLVTAGPTREAIDPVRYLSNRSSGKMGRALAEAAAARGHEVVLVSGPVALPPFEGGETLAVESAADMFEAVARALGGCDAAIFAAAVSDYTVAVPATEKIKKAGERLSLDLVPTRDILGAARGEMGFRGVLVGFAAETENLESHARGKLERKGCDLLVANDVSRADIGFDREENEVHLFFRDGSRRFLPRQAKSGIATVVIEEVERLAAQKN